MTIFSYMCTNTTHILEQIYRLPFVIELANGNLEKSKFIFYLQQDFLYLSQFSRALALTGSRYHDNKAMKIFIELALGAVNDEQLLYKKYLAEFGSPNSKLIKPSPTCFNYTNYLLKTASLATTEEAVASMLPCFWVYHKVGKVLLNISTKKSNPYHDWIELYGGDEFERAVEAIVQITNGIDKCIHKALRNKMLNAFTYSMQMEWMFWDSAYNLERWPNLHAG